jgi:hypothetical protein
MDVSPVRLLEDNAGRRQTEVTLVAALILLIVLIASLARSCPSLPSEGSTSPAPRALSPIQLPAPAASPQPDATTAAAQPRDPENQTGA